MRVAIKQIADGTCCLLATMWELTDTQVGVTGGVSAPAELGVIRHVDKGGIWERGTHVRKELEKRDRPERACGEGPGQGERNERTKLKRRKHPEVTKGWTEQGSGEHVIQNASCVLAHMQ